MSAAHEHPAVPTPGDPSESVLDCSAVLADVWLFLDHECDQHSRARLQQHLDECGPCLTAFGIEEQVKALLGRKCGGERAPDGLRARLDATIKRAVQDRVDAAPEGSTVDTLSGRVQI